MTVIYFYFYIMYSVVIFGIIVDDVRHFCDNLIFVTIIIVIITAVGLIVGYL